MYLEFARYPKKDAAVPNTTPIHKLYAPADLYLLLYIYIDKDRKKKEEEKRKKREKNEKRSFFIKVLK